MIITLWCIAFEAVLLYNGPRSFLDWGLLGSAAGMHDCAVRAFLRVLFRVIGSLTTPEALWALYSRRNWLSLATKSGLRWYRSHHGDQPATHPNGPIWSDCIDYGIWPVCSINCFPWPDLFSTHAGVLVVHVFRTFASFPSLLGTLSPKGCLNNTLTTHWERVSLDASSPQCTSVVTRGNDLTNRE